jgi:hypothetical protein
MYLSTDSSQEDRQQALLTDRTQSQQAFLLPLTSHSSSLITAQGTPYHNTGWPAAVQADTVLSVNLVSALWNICLYWR